jgi:opacity protein-like surface antigen
MKKIILAAALASVASSAFASENAFYVRADAGASFTTKEKVGEVKSKKNTHFVAGLGVGTYLMDNVRAELNITNHFSAHPKLKSMDVVANTVSKAPVPAVEGKSGNPKGTLSGKAKFTATSIMLGGLVDFADLGYAKLFAGASVGMTQLGAKSAVTLKPTETADAALGKTYNAKAKKHFTFSYALTAGASMEAADGVMVDVAYRFADLGKTKAFKGTDPYNGLAVTGGKARLKSHDVTAGVRFEL